MQSEKMQLYACHTPYTKINIKGLKAKMLKLLKEYIEFL